MEVLIEIKNATKQYKKSYVFKDVNLEVRKGKSYGFIGYNGCGKSVFLKCICGLSKLNEGQIVYKGKEIRKDIDFICNAGVVIESPEFIGDLSGYKNLKIISEIQNKINDDDIFETMKLFDLYDDKDKKVKEYSLGMKQKLRLAQACMETPNILILDEPTNGLDKESVNKLYNYLNEFKKNGGTLLLSSHHKSDIDACCDKVYEFKDKGLEELV